MQEQQQSRAKRTLKQEAEQIAELERRISEEAPAPGSIPTGKTRFDELPISTNTTKGQCGRAVRAARARAGDCAPLTAERRARSA